MADEARSVRTGTTERVLTFSSIAAYEVIQCPSGRAGFYDSSVGANANTYVNVTTGDTCTCQKTTGFVALRGNRAYWDHSAAKVYYKPVSDRDFYIGRFAQDASSASDNCEVVLNADPAYDIDLARDAFISILVGTPAAGGFGYPLSQGGSTVLELTATSEAQKVDALSVAGFSKVSNVIVEGAFRVLADGAGATPDLSLGIANASHTSDADLITESCFIHLNGNDLNIYAESDDGITEVAATDTTIDYTEGSSLSVRVEFWIDMRDEADVQFYINGSNVLPSSVFALGDAAGPFFLLAHLEKTSSTDVYKVAVDWMRARLCEYN